MKRLGAYIPALQRELGPGIERILGAQGDLLVVMDAVDDDADERVAAISQQVPIASAVLVGELLLDALLCALALRCGTETPPESRTAGVWLYADALLSGRLQPDDALLIMRVVALAQAEDQVPSDLLATLASDVARFIEDTANRTEKNPGPMS